MQLIVQPMDRCSPPWPVMALLAEYLEPQTLSIASCVSKSWCSIFSSDHLWTSHCLSHYPAASLHLTAHGRIDGASPRHIFLTLHAASNRRRPLSSAPRISLRDLIFTVDVFAGAGGGSRRAPLVSLAKPGDELRESGTGRGLFRFDVDVGSGGVAVDVADEELRVVWMVVMKGCRGAFAMMDKVGNGRLLGGTEMWFSEELPHAAACCAHSPAGSGRSPLQSEVWMRVAEGDGGGEDGAGRKKKRRRAIKKMTLGLMNTAAWRYAGIDDALIYLQRYLLPSHSHM